MERLPQRGELLERETESLDAWLDEENEETQALASDSWVDGDAAQGNTQKEIERQRPEEGREENNEFHFRICWVEENIQFDHIE